MVDKTGHNKMKGTGGQTTHRNGFPYANSGGTYPPSSSLMEKPTDVTYAVISCRLLQYSSL